MRHLLEERGRAPAAQDDALVVLRCRHDLVGGQHAQLDLVDGEPLEEALRALEEADDVALADARAVGEVIDDLVVLDLEPELLAQSLGDVLAERPHFPIHRDERHDVLPPGEIVAQPQALGAYSRRN